MGSWRTQAVVVLLALGWLPATAQSLGDVARAERERRLKMPHHAPVLSDEDLVRDKILQKAPRDASPPSDNGTDAAASENVSLGDYARALRQRRAAEQASAPNAAQPAIESDSTGSNPVALTPLSGVVGPDQQTMSLGDVARQARAEREAARLARTHSNPPQPAAANTVPIPTTGVSPGLARSATPRPRSSAPPTLHSRVVLEPGAMANGQSIRVPRGGSLWKLARVYLGAGRLWPALWKANPQIQNPNHIQVGQLLRYPVLRDQEPSDSSRSASLKRPSSAGVPAADSVAAPAAGRAAQLTPTRPGIRADERLRKSLFSRALSR